MVFELVVLDPGFEVVIQDDAKRVVDDLPPNVRNIDDEVKNEGDSDAALHEVDVCEQKVAGGPDDSVDNEIGSFGVAEYLEMVHDVAHQGDENEFEIDNRFKNLVGFGSHFEVVAVEEEQAQVVGREQSLRQGTQYYSQAEHLQLEIIFWGNLILRHSISWINF